jgi:hypothetical protein
MENNKELQELKKKYNKLQNEQKVLYKKIKSIEDAASKEKLQSLKGKIIKVADRFPTLRGEEKIEFDYFRVLDILRYGDVTYETDRGYSQEVVLAVEGVKHSWMGSKYEWYVGEQKIAEHDIEIMTDQEKFEEDMVHIIEAVRKSISNFKFYQTKIENFIFTDGK